MISKDLLKTIISDNQKRELPEIWRRDLTIPLESEKIITLAGVRRSGKTYRLFDIINRLKQSGVDSNQVLYLNFEDERFELESNELDLILQSFRELYPEKELSRCYFLFDEIQVVEGWEKFVTRVHNTISKNIFITGSNASLLSREIASALRGKTLTFEVYPLSFSEFVHIMDPNINLNTSKGKASLANHFERFLKQGGFPELINLPPELHDKTLQEYFNVMVLRDLIERYEISQGSILKYFCKRVVGTSAGEFSVNKIYRELKSQGYKISKDTIYDFQDYLESVYLSLFIIKYSPSVVKRELASRKAYVIDHGLGSALDYKFAGDEGRKFETAIVLEFIKAGEQITYFQNGFECDIVLFEKDHVKDAIQITLEMDTEQTRRREINGLLNTCRRLDLDSGTIITKNLSDVLIQENITIELIPAWKYFYQA